MNFRILLCLFCFSILSFSCTVHNRLTSPEVLSKRERTWTCGLIIDPSQAAFIDDSDIYAFSPVIGYRAGLGGKQELGVTLNGIVTPSLVVDYKHQFLKRNQFVLSGDLAAYYGVLRPTGLQYDLLFGNRKLYGTTGFGRNLISFDDVPPVYSYATLGIGKEGIGVKENFGFQISYLGSFANPDTEALHFLSFGFKFDFLKNKRKYR
jgi:hypothetical protein